MSIQPSAFFLMTFSYLNNLLYQKQKYIKSFFVLIFYLFLLMLQPDFGSSLLLVSIWLSNIFLFEKFHIFKKYLTFIGLMFVIFLIFKGMYAIERIKFVLKGNDEINQTNLALKAIMFSGWIGSKHIIYIPEMHNDYFFAAFTNVYGFIPMVILVNLMGYLFLTMANGIESQNNEFFKGIMMGSLTYLIGQFFLHVFTNINLIPAKGISLPLISAGGSLIIANLFSLGIFLFCLYQKDEKQ
jgi:cell division protein FtsW